jgi:type IV pilus assembly protein PilE
MRVTTTYQQGFTLIELMVVVAITGILLAIAVPNYSAYVLTSRENDGREDVHRVMAQQERYFLKKMQYTADLGPDGIGYILTGGQLISPGGLFVMTASRTCDNSNVAAGFVKTKAECVKITATGRNQMDGTIFWLESDGDKSANL